MLRLIVLLSCLLAGQSSLTAQTVDENQLGAWYMYFFGTTFGDGPWGIQGDAQFRYWDFGSDLEQLLLRGGLTYTPEGTTTKLTLGYANITSGTPGASSDKSYENRIYQEALLPQKIGKRIYLTHRFRYEERFVEDQDFRTRYRYNIFLNLPLNATELARGTFYLALYNELFINGQTDIGDGRTVQRFDRNRTYLGVGYGLRDNLRAQFGWMKQSTVAWSKQQLQFSAHHSW